MKRFQFPLARLERLRSHDEREARRRLAAALGVVNELRGRIEAVERNLEICAEETGSAAALQRAMTAGLQKIKLRLTKELVDAEVISKAALEIYQQRRRDRRMLTNLHEKRLEAWKAEALADEQSQMEELARMQSAVKRRSGG